MIASERLLTWRRKIFFINISRRQLIRSRRGTKRGRKCKIGCMVTRMSIGISAQPIIDVSQLNQSRQLRWSSDL
jgi:hypothetical protein